MMASFMSYFGARRDPKASARDAIVTLRQQLQMIEKKEEYLQKKIDEELKKARANAVSNKAVATAALKRKKASEAEIDRLAGTRLQLEMQINTLESANLNAETLAAMKKGAEVLKVIHTTMSVDKADTVINQVNEQRAMADELAEIIANPGYAGAELDEDELKAELEELEHAELNDRLRGADSVPAHLPETQGVQPNRTQTVVEDDEEAQLRQLQAELAM